MIEINELRIWNTVSLGIWDKKWFSVPYQIMGVKVAKPATSNNGYKSAEWIVEMVSMASFGVTTQKLTDIYPIPLDHDVLINLGFTFDNESNRYYKDRFFLRKHCKGEHVFYKLARGGIFNNKLVMSVHELQNIYHALYDVELLYSYQPQ